jgi:hypothetical protein
MSKVVVEIRRGLVEAAWSDDPSSIELFVIDHDQSRCYDEADERGAARIDAYDVLPLSEAKADVRSLLDVGYENPGGHAILTPNGSFLVPSQP